MKQIKKSSELLWLFGIVFVALGVAICDKANLGVSMIAAPAFIISEALSPISSFFSVGASEYLIQGLLLLILCIIVRKFNLKFILAFAVAIIYGYTLDLFILIFEGVEVSAVWARWLFLILGDVVTGFGVACFFRTYLPLQVYELFVAEMARFFKISVNKIKCAFDVSLLVISIVLVLVIFGDVGSFDFTAITYTSFHSIGLGTIVTTLINSPIISTMGRIIDKFFESTPLFPKAKDFLSHDQNIKEG
jgi:uncharacterized membrane protein YczE